MPFFQLFPATTWLGRAVSGRTARRIYAAVLLVGLLVGTLIRVHTYILARRFQRILVALSTLQIDQSTEADLQRQVPYLVRTKYERDVKPNVETGDVETGTLRAYCASYTNRDSWMRFESFAWNQTRTGIGKNLRQDGWLFLLADVLGYRYIDFSTCALTLDGKVSRISYGVADDLVFPLSVGEVVSVTSFHSRWGPRRMYAHVTAAADESPAFLANEYDGRLSILFNPDAPPALRADLFHLNLSCFWRLFRCDDAREIAPALVHDKEAIDAAALARLKSPNPCPDRIISARARYWPDVPVALLSSLGSQNADVSEEGGRAYDIWTHYRLVKVLRGAVPDGWQFVKSSRTIPNPLHPTELMGNNGLQWTKPGDLVLMFFGPESCRVIPATPSAMAAFQKTPPEPRRVEDERVTGLL